MLTNVAVGHLSYEELIANYVTIQQEREETPGNAGEQGQFDF